MDALAQPNRRRTWWKVIFWTIAVLVAVVFILAVVLIGLVAWQVRQYELLTDSHDLKARIDALGDRYVADRAGSGLAIAIFQRGAHSFHGFGSRGNGIAEPPDERTVFEIGSVTKLFTGVALAQLEMQRTVTLDDTLPKHLPVNVYLPGPLQQITLRQLATHTSGLPRLPHDFEPSDESDPYADYTANDLYRTLAIAELTSTPGTTSEYSNLGMGLLGHMLALRAGTSYESLVRQTICEPLFMHDTAISLSAEQQSRLTPGHDPEGNMAPNWNFDVLAPAGALRSTTHDMLLFLEANLADRDDSIGKALSRARQRHFQHWARDVGLAWQIEKAPEGLIQHWHNGGTGGYVSFVGLDEKHQVGVVLLSNYGDAWAGDSTLDQIGMEILKLATKISLE